MIDDDRDRLTRLGAFSSVELTASQLLFGRAHAVVTVRADGEVATASASTRMVP